MSFHEFSKKVELNVFPYSVWFTSSAAVVRNPVGPILLGAPDFSGLVDPH